MRSCVCCMHVDRAEVVYQSTCQWQFLMSRNPCINCVYGFFFSLFSITLCSPTMAEIFFWKNFKKSFNAIRRWRHLPAKRSEKIWKNRHLSIRQSRAHSTSVITKLSIQHDDDTDKHTGGRRGGRVDRVPENKRMLCYAHENLSLALLLLFTLCNHVSLIPFQINCFSFIFFFWLPSATNWFVYLLMDYFDIYIIFPPTPPPSLLFPLLRAVEKKEKLFLFALLLLPIGSSMKSFFFWQFIFFFFLVS